MLELQSDLVRRMALGKASVGVRATGATLGNYQSSLKQTYRIENRPVAKKRGTSWFAVVALALFVPLFMSANTPRDHEYHGDKTAFAYDGGGIGDAMADISQ